MDTLTQHENHTLQYYSSDHVMGAANSHGLRESIHILLVIGIRVSLIMLVFGNHTHASSFYYIIYIEVYSYGIICTCMALCTRLWYSLILAQLSGMKLGAIYLLVDVLPSVLVSDLPFL